MEAAAAAVISRGRRRLSNTGPASASSAGKSIDFSYPVNITADPATNAMVISASPQDWQTLKQIIDDLDTPRVQIFVQAVIVEVSAERQRQLGVNFYANGVGGGSAFGVGGLNFGQLQSALTDPLSVYRPWPRPRLEERRVRFLPRLWLPPRRQRHTTTTTTTTAT